MSLRACATNRHEEQWQKKFQQLRAFHSTHGHYNVPTIVPCLDVASAYVANTTYTEEELEYYYDDSYDELCNVETDEFWDEMIELGRWARGQRVIYRKYMRGENLQPHTLQRMIQLEEIGFMDEADQFHGANQITKLSGYKYQALFF